MSPESIKEYINQGMSNGTRAGDLRFTALHELGISPQDFDRAYDAIMLGPVFVPEPKLVVNESPISNPVIITPQVEVIVAPHPKKTSFFGWFKLHKAVAFAVVIVVAISTVGVVAANYFMAPGVDEIRSLVFKQLQEMDTVVYQGSVEGEITTDALLSLENILKHSPDKTFASISEGRVAGSKNTKLRVDFNGASDVRDSNNPKAEFSFTVTAEGLVVGVEAKSVAEDLFFKLTQVPDLGGFDVSQYINQWYKIDSHAIAEAAGDEMPTRESSLTVEQKQRLIEIFSTSNIFKIAEKLESESIEGKATHHYRYSIDEDEVVGALEQIGAVLGSTEKLSAQDREVLLEWMDFAGGEIWLAKKDYSPVKMTFEIAMRSVSNVPVTGRLAFSLQFNKYNEEVNIEAPYPFKDLSEILIGSKEEATIASRDAQRLGDVRMLMTAMELYYNDYGSYPRTFDQLMEADYPLLLEIPFAPQPPDGTCTAIQNEYLYKPTINNKDYSLTFCLGEDSSIYKAGLRTASSSGIK